jgi:hypothetical protein
VPQFVPAFSPLRRRYEERGRPNPLVDAARRPQSTIP